MSGTVETPMAGPGRITGLAPAAILVVACVAAFAVLLMTQPVVPGAVEIAGPLDTIILWQSLVPRAVIALIAGAALGLTGTLFQRILRNPIADASTLGVASGAQLALTIGLGFVPMLGGASRELVAFSGGTVAVLFVLMLSARRGFDPVTVAISGMIISMIAASLSATIILARGEYAMSINIWGAGALNQQDWSGVLSLAPRLVAGVVASLFLLRSLTVLSLDDTSAKSLGIGLAALRLAVIVLAVWLSASVTATVGIIGFLGLAAPVIAKLCGARTTGQVMVWAPLCGAAVLFLTDCLTQILGPGFTDIAPTGAATALIGGPLLLFLLPRVHSLSPAGGGETSARRLGRPGGLLAGLLACLGLVLVVGLTVAPGMAGWSVALGASFTELLPFRLPHLVTAAGAGGLVGAAGFIMQRVTGNPIASPEMLGVSAGAGAGLTVVLFLFGFPSPPMMLIGMALGALVAFLVMAAVSSRSGFSAERLLLAGIAVSAMSMALIGIVLAQGDMRPYILLTWISGSTSRAGAFEAWTAVISLAVLATPLLMFSRWFTILPLGTTTSRSIGLGVTRSRLALSVFAALMTAISSYLIGPLSLAGLIAPHLSRMIGLSRPQHQLAGAILIGAGVLGLADWLSRVVIFPYQVPVGLFAALIGGPYLLLLLGRKG